jgi:hypothetical protein
MRQRTAGGTSEALHWPNAKSVLVGPHQIIFFLRKYLLPRIGISIRIGIAERMQSPVNPELRL